TIGTRPIIDRVKQALFNIIASRVENARFLDLFAGTGSVGIEALSRGAASATFIELDHKALAVVRENLQITALADRAQTIHADAFKFLQNGLTQAPYAPYAPYTSHPQHRHNKQHKKHSGTSSAQPRSEPATPAPTVSTVSTVSTAPYDIIYVAPPQYQAMAARALGILDSSPLVPRTGLIIIQIHPKERDAVVAVPLTRLALTDERRYGSTLLMFYTVKEEQSLQDQHVHFSLPPQQQTSGVTLAVCNDPDGLGITLQQR
ncbi:MAG TPA: RsmD family RNA methyltransferase, partial [Ktedonobacteraceae bacterium]